MNKSDVLTDPKKLVQLELKKAGFDLENMNVPKRVFLLADGIYDSMLKRNLGEYIYPLGGRLHSFKDNPSIGFVKGKMCSPGIATQAEDLIAGGVKELIHVGFAGGIQEEIKIGQIVITDGAYNDTAVAGLYGLDYDFLETSKELTDELNLLFEKHSVSVLRGIHWTTDAGYHETWGQILNYRLKGALCVEMEGIGLFAIAKYRKRFASAIYVVTDVLDENGWTLGWDSSMIDETVEGIIDVIVESVKK